MSDSVRDGVGELTNRVVHGRWVNIVDCRCNLVPVMDRTARLLALHNKLVADVAVTVTVMCELVLECLLRCKGVLECLIMSKSVLECLIGWTADGALVENIIIQPLSIPSRVPRRGCSYFFCSNTLPSFATDTYK